MGCRAHLCQLPGLGQVGHSPKGTSGSAGTLDWGPIWSGSLSPCHHLTNPKTDRLIFCLTAGWLANCSWQAGWLSDCLTKKCQPSHSPLVKTSCGHVCDDLGHIDKMYHPPVETSHGQLWAGCPSVICPPHPPHETRFASGQISSQVN